MMDNRIENLQQLTQLLSDRGWGFADLAACTGLTDKSVRLALFRWAGKRHGTRTPRGNTMRVVRLASIVAGTPVTPAVEWIFTTDWRYETKPDMPQRRAA